MNEDEKMPEEPEQPEEQINFVDCTCDHDPGDHGWGHCNVEGCPCEGGWEE